MSLFGSCERLQPPASHRRGGPGDFKTGGGDSRHSKHPIGPNEMHGVHLQGIVKTWHVVGITVCVVQRGNYLNNSFHNDIFDQNKLNKLRKTLSESGFDVNESQDDGDILSCLNDEIRSYYAGIRYYYDYVSELAVRQKRFYRSITQGTCEVTTGRLSTPRPSSEPPSSPEHSTATSPSESSPHPSSSSSPHPSPSSPHPSSSSPWTPSLQFLIERYRSRSGPRRPRGGF